MRIGKRRKVVRDNKLSYFKTEIMPKLKDYSIVEFNTSSFRISKYDSLIFIDFYPKGQRLFIYKTKERLSLTSDELLQNIETYFNK